MSGCDARRVRACIRFRCGLYKRFRERVREVFGRFRGMRDMVLEDALRVWLSLSREDGEVLFGYVEGMGQRAVSVRADFPGLVKESREFRLVAFSSLMVHPVVLEVLRDMGPVEVYLRRGNMAVLVDFSKMDLLELRRRLSVGWELHLFWHDKCVTLKMRQVELVRRSEHCGLLRYFILRSLVRFGD